MAHDDGAGFDDLVPLMVAETTEGSADDLTPGASPLGSRLPLLAVVVAVLLVAGLLAVVLVSADSETPGQRLAAASGAARETRSFRTEIVSTASFAGSGAFTFSGSGLVDLDTERAQMTMTIGPVSIEGLSDGTSVYVRLPESVVRSYGGKTWARVDASSMQAQLGAGGFGTTNPLDPLEALRQLELVRSEVVEVGEEEIRGIDATHFRTTLDLSAAIPAAMRAELAGATEFLDSFAQVPYDVWLDSDDRPIRQRLVLDVTIGADDGPIGRRDFHSETTVDMLDFGLEVEVTLPAADQVVDVDATQLGRLFVTAGS